MRISKHFAVIVPALVVFMGLLSVTPAQAQGPRYLHALANLRQARGWIQSDTRPQFADLRHHAIDEIDHAINEVKRAARDDGKNVNFTPPADSAGRPGAPIISALQLLDDAHSDVSAGQDLPENQGLQTRALNQIDAARNYLHQIRQMLGAR
jgi:hypothetical protein